MKDKLGRELNIGDTVVYSQSNHSVVPMIGKIEYFNGETACIKTETNRKVLRHSRELIILKQINS
jgi:hypothetical protein